jgi:predicted dehydrogenase
MAEAPGVELAAVVDPDPKARRYAEATPGYKVLEEALEAVECDAVLVASPPGTHHVVAKAALEAGRHVLCEKPLATSLEDAFDLVRAAEGQGVSLWSARTTVTTRRSAPCSGS